MNLLVGDLVRPSCLILYLKLQIYFTCFRFTPSEFGSQRMKEEDLKGPKELVTIATDDDERRNENGIYHVLYEFV